MLAAASVAIARQNPLEDISRQNQFLTLSLSAYIYIYYYYYIYRQPIIYKIYKMEMVPK